jgi:hypothetical protein
MKKFASVGFDESATEWMTVLNLRKLRNCIVRAQGYVKEENRALKQWIQSTPGISLAPFSESVTPPQTQHFPFREPLLLACSIWQRTGTSGSDTLTLAAQRPTLTL